MRRVLFFMMTSLDGYFEGPGQSIDWHTADEEFNQFAIDQIGEVDTLLFGRVTYEGMASYWPTPDAVANDPEVAGLMNSLPKVVFSNTLPGADWSNTTLVAGDAAEELARLKQQPGKDMIVLGSSNLAASLAERGLIDEFRIMINPVLLGGGTPLLHGIYQRLNLRLLSARPFASGNVLLSYAPDGSR